MKQHARICALGLTAAAAVACATQAGPGLGEIMALTQTRLAAGGVAPLPLSELVPQWRSRAAQASCAASPLLEDTASREPEAAPVGPAHWYINADRTLWAGPVPDGGWPAGGTLYSGKGTVRGQKTYWVRPKGAALVIDGRRLDASAPPLEASIPCCYTSGFQVVGLLFPTEGCWEVHAKAGGSELRFVTQVRADATIGR